MIYIKERIPTLSLPRPLKLIAAFVFGTGVITAVLMTALAYGVSGEMDYQNERRIEAEKITYCANNPGVSDCLTAPKTNRWRN